MSNTYVKAAFAVTMSRADAAIIRDAETACEIIEDAGENVDLAPAYERLPRCVERAGRFEHGGS